MPLRDVLARDVGRAFLNLDEFGETHTVAGKDIACVIDEVTSKEADELGSLGAASLNFTLFCRESDIKRQTEGTRLEIDGAIYLVLDWRVDEGMARVTLAHPTAVGGW